MKLVLLGPPGVGKGTQGRMLSEWYGVPLIATGEILRDAVVRGTPLGKEAKTVMDSGQLVNDEIVVGLVRERVAQPDAARGFILDGFPRTVEQAKALDVLLQGKGERLDGVVHLYAEEKELLRRLTARRECPTCQRVYNLVSHPPRDGKNCDVDGTLLVQRADDREETVRRRLEVYRAQTEPLVEHYRRQSRLREVSSAGAIARVYDAIAAALGR